MRENVRKRPPQPMALEQESKRRVFQLAIPTNSMKVNARRIPLPLMESMLEPN